MVGTALMAACGATADQSGLSSDGGYTRGPQAAPLPGAPDGTVSGAGGAGGSKESAPAGGTAAGSAPVSVLSPNRALVRTAQLGVEVRDLTSAAARARAYVATSGGQISSENSVLTADASLDRPYPGPIPGSFVQMAITLPPDSLDASIDSLAQLGEVTSRAQSVEDVTLQVVDLESRTASMRASIDRVRALMDRATSIADVVALESELSRREADLESMTGQLHVLESQSATSTLILTLSAASAAAPVDNGRDGPLGALQDSLGALRSASVAVVTGLAAALPFVAVIALVGGAGWAVLRPRRALAPVGPATSDEAPLAQDDPAPIED